MKNGYRFAVGVDYGTNSCRAVIANLADGGEIASSTFDYPSGTDGILLADDPNLARQNPLDYMSGFITSVRSAVRKARRKKGFDPARVAGIGIDTTGSTPIPVDRKGAPLAAHREFRNKLAAHAWLWKDHTAHAEAEEITDLGRRWRPRYLDKCGGLYSSEWYWSKILRCRRSAPEVFRAAFSWVELADFIPAWLTGRTDPVALSRGICAAGHKALYHEAWGGLPSRRFLASLHPDLAPLRDRYARRAETSDQRVGGLTESLAKAVGLLPGTPVAVGAFDAHMGAVGAGVRTGTLVKIIGTSTCDIMVAPGSRRLPDIPGLCGMVPGSVIPGMIGLEAGQSAVGDIFNWFVERLCPERDSGRGDPHVALSRAARNLAPGESGLLALDWNNGNRTILVDARLTGLLMGQTLQTTAPEIYRALVEATAFGALTIIRRLEEYGVKVREVVNCGGIAEKNDFVMQIYADACNRPMKVSRSPQTCALGAAIFGAVAGGAFRSVRAAQRKMTGVKRRVFRPRQSHARVYAELYALYRRLHDAFGTRTAREAVGDVMKELIAIRTRARKTTKR